MNIENVIDNAISALENDCDWNMRQSAANDLRQLPEFKDDGFVSPDSNVEKNREMLLQRSILGLKKYGVTTDNGATTNGQPQDLRYWLQHALEECLDMANYLQAAISKLDQTGAENDNH